MSKSSAIRDVIERVIGTAERRSTHAGDVIPFRPGGAAPKVVRKVRKKKPKVVKSITPHHRKDDAHSRTFTHRDVEGNEYKPVTVNGKNYMQRTDGALFALRKDGKWVLTQRRGGVWKKKQSGIGKVLPYVAAAGAGGAAAYLATRKK